MSHSLRTKILLISTVIVFIALSLNTLVGSTVFKREYSQAFQSKVLVTGQTLKLQLERLLTLGIPLDELVGFEEQCRDTVERHTVSYAMVVGSRGRILFHHDPRMQG